MGHPRSPKTPLRGAVGRLIYTSYEMMCFNEFLYHCGRFLYTSCLFPSYLIKSQFVGHAGVLRPLKGGWGHLTYKSYEMMCFNDFLYQWDKFWHTSYLYSIIFDKITIFFGPLRGPKTPLWGTGGPWHTHFMTWCVSMSCCIIGINFDIHHGYISSYLIKSQFFGSSGAVRPL